MEVNVNMNLGFIACFIVILKLKDNPDIEELRRMMKMIKLKKL